LAILSPVDPDYVYRVLEYDHHKQINHKKMGQLIFEIMISAKPQKVWETMLAPETYKEWANASWPGSQYEGVWGQGQQIKFVSPGKGGTLAALAQCKPFALIEARHIAVLRKDGSEDRNSKEAKSWIGATESYRFTEIGEQTSLTVDMNVSHQWVAMFTRDWPKALAKLKEICER
jgi:uncharacterized protein YndB with AHSA1/START domain